MNQWRVEEYKNKRCDMVVMVNGLPLVVATGLRYSWNNEKGEFEKRTGVEKLILLLDGNWKQHHLDFLLNSGWDEIFYPDEIDKLKHTNSITGGRDVKRPNPSGTACCSAVFPACFAELVCFFTEHLAGKRAFADAGGISLHDADNIMKLVVWYSRAYRRISGDSVGGGCEWIDSKVYIAQRTELCLKEYLSSFFFRIVQI